MLQEAVEAKRVRVVTQEGLDLYLFPQTEYEKVDIRSNKFSGEFAKETTEEAMTVLEEENWGFRPGDCPAAGLESLEDKPQPQPLEDCTCRQVSFW